MLVLLINLLGEDLILNLMFLNLGERLVEIIEGEHTLEVLIPCRSLLLLPHLPLKHFLVKGHQDEGGSEEDKQTTNLCQSSDQSPLRSDGKNCYKLAK